MMNNDNPSPPSLELEQAIHDLLCADPDNKHADTLLAICRDPAARELAEEIILTQAMARRAVGMDGIEAVMSSNLARLLTRMRREQRRPALRLAPDSRAAETRPARTPTWARCCAAASVLLAVALGYTIWLHDTTDQLANELDRLSTPVLDIEDMRVDDRIERSRAAWRMVAANDNTWLLLSDGEGVFGTVAPDGRPVDNTQRMIFLNCRLTDEQGREVYDADLLVPDGAVQIQLPNAGRVRGRIASLRVSTAGNHAVVGLMIDGNAAAPLGVTGETVIDGSARELGRFKLDEQTLHFNVTTERIADLTY